MITFMNQYWWGNINKATKSAYTSLSHLLKYKWEVLGSLFVMLLDILNCLTDDQMSGKWISYNLLYIVDINMFQTWSVYFHTELKLSLADRLLPLLWLTSFGKRLSLLSELLLNLIMIEEPILQVRYFDNSALFGQFYTFTVLTTLNPLVQSNALMSLRFNWRGLPWWRSG